MVEQDCALVSAFQGHSDVGFGSVGGSFSGSSDHLSAKAFEDVGFFSGHLLGKSDDAFVVAHC